MTPAATRLVGERGAVLVHVGIALVALLAFSSVVIDYGVLWVSRHQAQNAADAGALAGATALSYDSYTDRTDSGPAKMSAYRVAQANHVWAESPVTDVASDITFPTCPDGGDGCIRVNVYRNEERGNALPTFFAQLAGVYAQGVKATATAESAVANGTNCMKPWMIPDKWQENNPTPEPPVPWSSDYTFDRYTNQGALIANPDVYVAPTATDPGTGFTIANDRGAFLTLKAGTPAQAISPGFFYVVDLPAPGGGNPSGADVYRTNIENCNGATVKIGDTLPPENGNMVGPTKQGVDALIARDPNATWNPTTMTVDNSCAPACGAISPRLVPLGVFSPDLYAQGQTQGKGSILTITNILGFFINSVSADGTVTGYLTLTPGQATGPAPVGTPSSFAKAIILVR